MRIFSILTLSVLTLLLAGCGGQQQSAPNPQVTATEKSTPVEPANGSIKAGMQPEPKSAKHKFTRLTEKELYNKTQGKTIPEVIEILGEPAAKKPHMRKYLPDCWLYEWDIVIEAESGDLEYPKVGMVFKTPDAPVGQWDLDEYLPGGTPPQ